MLSLAQQHFSRTRSLAEQVDHDEIASWLLNAGYYPEQYVLPPCFAVQHFALKNEPYFEIKKAKSGSNRTFHPTPSELSNVFFPKSQLTDRIFGIIEPRLYHDIVWHLKSEFDSVLSHLFHQDTRFFCYSFPVPVTEKAEGELGSLRSGRMIYEFIEMAENDLVADAHSYQYVVHTDIKNLYPSIYAHSIAWALHEKDPSRADKTKFHLLGNRLDKLFQNANDGCTNGLAIGPVVSDIAAEIVLSAIDRRCSHELSGVDFVGVRFKDDYRIPCHNNGDADNIIKTLQREMRYFNLYLNESKTTIKELPNGLFRPWILEYQPLSLKKRTSINYRTFETTLLAVLEIDARHPDTGIIDKFLSELVTKDYRLKLTLERKQILKTFSLLFMLKKRRAKAFPQILAIIELLIEQYERSEDLVNAVVDDVQRHFRDNADYLYDDLWIVYFLKSHGRDFLETTNIDQNPLLRSIKTNKQEFFNSQPDINLFKPVGSGGESALLAKHLTIFPREG